MPNQFITDPIAAAIAFMSRDPNTPMMFGKPPVYDGSFGVATDAAGRITAAGNTESFAAQNPNAQTFNPGTYTPGMTPEVYTGLQSRAFKMPEAETVDEHGWNAENMAAFERLRAAIPQRALDPFAVEAMESMIAPPVYRGAEPKRFSALAEHESSPRFSVPEPPPAYSKPAVYRGLESLRIGPQNSAVDQLRTNAMRADINDRYGAEAEARQRLTDLQPVTAEEAQAAGFDPDTVRTLNFTRGDLRAASNRLTQRDAEARQAMAVEAERTRRELGVVDRRFQNEAAQDARRRAELEAALAPIRGQYENEVRRVAGTAEFQQADQQAQRDMLEQVRARYEGEQARAMERLAVTYGNPSVSFRPGQGSGIDYLAGR